MAPTTVRGAWVSFNHSVNVVCEIAVHNNLEASEIFPEHRRGIPCYFSVCTPFATKVFPWPFSRTTMVNDRRQVAYGSLWRLQS